MRPGEIATTFVGNLTADPELRFTPNGLAVAQFTVAVNPRRYNRETAPQDDPWATSVPAPTVPDEPPF